MTLERTTASARRIANRYRLRLSAASLITLTLLCARIADAESPPKDNLVRDQYGAIIRGDTTAKKIALVFTGDEFGESTEPILDALKQRKIKAGFFVTGNFLRQIRLRALLQRAEAEGHYVGPHSDSHPLYASWDDRDKSLVTKEFFETDLRKNIAGLAAIGAIDRKTTIYFIPPYEQFNREQVAWSRAMNVTLINFTPNSGSNRDYAKEGDPHFASAQKIYDDILAYERKDPHGLNGFMLLMHLGSGRKDPLHALLGRLCDELANRGYQFERVDTLLK